MSFRALHSYTPRPKPLNYDALAIEYGCTDAAGVKQFGLNAFSEICVSRHTADPSSPFNKNEQTDVTLGPVAPGIPDGAFANSWVAWVATAGVRVNRGNFVIPPADTSGFQYPGLFTATKTDHLSWAFDVAANPAMVITTSPTGATLKWHIDEVLYNTTTLTATTPILLFTGILNKDQIAANNELVLIFLQPSHPHALYALFQRDGFVHRYTIMDDIRVPLAKLLAVGTTEDSRFIIYARTSFGDDVALKTDRYLISLEDDLSEINTRLTGGGYFNTAVSAGSLSGDNSKTAVSLTDGDYIDVIAEVSPFDEDPCKVGVTLSNGSYE